MNREQLSRPAERFLWAGILPVVLASCAYELTPNPNLVLPGMPAYHFDVSYYAPKLNRAIEVLLRRNHLGSDARLLIEGQGPEYLLAHTSDGAAFQPVPWLPESPLTAFEALSADRQETYLARYIARNPEQGWFLAPHTSDGATDNACTTAISSAVPVMRDMTAIWDLWYCDGNATVPALPLPIEFHDPTATSQGAISDLYAGNVKITKPSRLPVLVPPDMDVQVRGWLAYVPARYAIGGVAAMIDGIRVQQAEQVGPRPDISARLPGQTVFSFAVAASTRGLAPGPHRLSLIAINFRGQLAQPLITDLPFETVPLR